MINVLSVTLMAFSMHPNMHQATIEDSLESTDICDKLPFLGKSCEGFNKVQVAVCKIKANCTSLRCFFFVSLEQFPGLAC